MSGTAAATGAGAGAGARALAGAVAVSTVDSVPALHRTGRHENTTLASAVQAARLAARDRGVGSDTVIEHVVGVWDALAALPTSDPLHLPPLCRGERIRTTIALIVHTLRTLPESTTSGGILLQGVAGVGKTTVISAVHIIGPLVFDVLCVFWDFSSSKHGDGFNPLDIASAALRYSLGEEATSALPPATEACRPHGVTNWIRHCAVPSGEG